MAAASLLGTLPPDLARRWIKANVLAAAIVALAAVIQYALAHAVGGRDPQASGATVVFVYATGIALSAIGGAVTGVLTGAVLQRVIGALPVRNWIALQTAIAVTLGLMVESASGEAPRDPTIAPNLASVMISGAIIGLVEGSLEALVLRSVAYGTGIWIACSIAGYAAASLLWACGWRLLPPPAGLMGEFVNETYAVAGAVLSAIVMLEALSRLRPRGHT